VLRDRRVHKETTQLFPVRVDRKAIPGMMDSPELTVQTVRDGLVALITEPME